MMSYWRDGGRRGNRNCENNSEVVIGRILIAACVAAFVLSIASAKESK